MWRSNVMSASGDRGIAATSLVVEDEAIAIAEGLHRVDQAAVLGAPPAVEHDHGPRSFAEFTAPACGSSCQLPVDRNQSV